MGEVKCVYSSKRGRNGREAGGVASLFEGTQHEVGDDAFFGFAATF